MNRLAPSFGSFRWSGLTLLGICGLVAMLGCSDSAGGVNIWDAVSNDDVDAIKRYAAAGGDLNCRDSSGERPLMVAFDTQQRGAYETLLELGADPNAIMSNERTLVAWAAARSDDESWLKTALEHGGDPNLVSSSRASKHLHPPLRFAISTGSLEHVRLRNRLQPGIGLSLK